MSVSGASADHWSAIEERHRRAVDDDWLPGEGRAMEGEHPERPSTDSPTQRAGTTPSEHFAVAGQVAGSTLAHADKSGASILSEGELEPRRARDV